MGQGVGWARLRITRLSTPLDGHVRLAEEGGAAADDGRSLGERSEILYQFLVCILLR